MRALAFLAIVLSLSVAACGEVTSVTTSPLYSPVESQAESSLAISSGLLPPQPAPGLASISGILLSTANGLPIPETVFLLFPAEADGSLPTFLVEQNGIKGVSNARGEIVLTDVPPGVYYIGVWVPYSYSIVVEYSDKRTPRKIILRAGDRVNLGSLYAPWP